MGFISLQIGIKDTMVHKYLNEWIVNMTDITDEVLKIKNCIDSGQEYEYLLPVEEIYEPIYQNELDFSFEQI